MSTDETTADTTTTSPILIALAWLMVGIPLAYGLWQTIDRASALFTG
ncbi:MFS transporter small subunit [Nocardioides hwasunensis]|uniref:Oxalate:formate antiporter n=1 Tax=Nocardioides hwasunensis TaxID=397258 RepID=A0ABR8MCM5_9ACTN|nr:oxalate:formate antiporter [Nocardioides hwasunensis]MBD3913887.1 oxalate:formate antiporter [Nocardioides hwasunensis]